MTGQAEQVGTQTTNGSSGSTHLFSRICRLLPPQETRRAIRRHILQSQAELLKGVKTLVDSYVARLEAFAAEEEEPPPKRTSKIKIEDEGEKAKKA